MLKIAPDVFLLGHVRGANTFLLAGGGELTLVDSGMGGNAQTVTAQIQEAGFSLSALRTVVLTHAHTDHIGSAAEIARRSGAKILAHRLEVPYIEGRARLPAGSALQRIFLRFADAAMRPRIPLRVDRPLEDGDRIEAPGMRIVFLPGHTPGSIGLYQPERKLLICGDALFNLNPLTGRAGLQAPPAMLSSDAAQALETARRLANLPLEILCCGHGQPILHDAGEQVREFSVHSTN